jgi:hypothetical protein
MKVDIAQTGISNASVNSRNKQTFELARNATLEQQGNLY